MKKLDLAVTSVGKGGLALLTAVLVLPTGCRTTMGPDSIPAARFDYNTSIATFPNVVIAGPLGFSKREFFDAEPEAEQVPEVDLGFGKDDDQPSAQAAPPPPPPPQQAPPPPPRQSPPPPPPPQQQG